MPAKKRRATSEANLKCLFSAYRRRAKKKRIPFDLTIEEFKHITKKRCFICGAKPNQKYVHDHSQNSYKVPYIYNGIDQIRPAEGYVHGNVAACCKRCNTSKYTMSLEEFLNYIYSTYHYAIQPYLSKYWTHKKEQQRHD